MPTLVLYPLGPARKRLRVSLIVKQPFSCSGRFEGQKSVAPPLAPGLSNHYYQLFSLLPLPVFEPRCWLFPLNTAPCLVFSCVGFLLTGSEYFSKRPLLPSVYLLRARISLRDLPIRERVLVIVDPSGKRPLDAPPPPPSITPRLNPLPPPPIVTFFLDDSPRGGVPAFAFNPPLHTPTASARTSPPFPLPFSWQKTSLREYPF